MHRLLSLKNLFSFFSIALLLLASSHYSLAQKGKDSSGKIPITIVNNRTFEAFKTDTANYFKFIGDVQFMHGTDLMFCDTALLNQEKNNLQAFGNVKIVQQDGTTVQSNYLSYTGNSKKAYLLGNVALNSGNDNLWTEEFDYNLKTKIGNYYKEGTLQTATTTVSSVLGTYNTQTKEARFTKDVFVTDTAFEIQSQDIGYNTESKQMRFFDQTIVTNENSVLRTSRGNYDSKNQIAYFDSRSSILNNEQYIEGDTLYYNKQVGKGKAIGDVIVWDTAQNTTVYCGRAFYDDVQKTLLAVDKPVLKKKSESDSTFMRADTFFSAHYATQKIVAKDTAKSAPSKANKKAVKDTISKTIQTADTTAPKFYSGFHHVRIFSDSLQGKCDSVSFSGKDSIILLMKKPAVWSRRSQITGDTIIAFVKEGKVYKVVVPNEALIVSRSGPEQANLFNQVQGRTLIANMVNEQLDNAVVKPEAECIYYPTDKNGAYIGAMKANAERMKIYFAEGEISKILLEQEVKQTMSPLNKIDIPTYRLSRFQWLEELRPKSILELFD